MKDLPVAFVAMLLAACVVAEPWAVQRPPGEDVQRPPTFTSGVDLVEVDVSVTDGAGRFVRDLGLDDFEILEDGKRQEASAFELIDFPYAPRPMPASSPAPRVQPDVRTNAAAPTGRVFVLVLDDLHTDPLRSTQARAAARQFVERHVGADDLVAVIYTSGRSDAGQEFTPDAGLVLASIDKFIGRKVRSSTLVRLEEYQRRQGLGMDANSTADIRMQTQSDPLEIERARQAETMADALQRLGAGLADTRGRRKAVVLVSEGIDYDVQGVMTQTSGGSPTSTSTYGLDVARRVRDAIAILTRANVVVYGIDPRGVVTSGSELVQMGTPAGNPLVGLSSTSFEAEVRRAHESLRMISEETGGIASVGSNDFTGVFDRIMRDNSTYYMLAYHSNNRGTDGRFRRIDVRVRRQGVEVHARKGYLAPTSREAASRVGDPARRDTVAVLQQAVRGTLPLNGVPLRAFAAPFKGPGGSASVLLAIEVDARNFTFAQRDGVYTDRLDAAAVSIDQKGSVLEGDRQTVNLELKSSTYDVVRTKGVRLLFRLAVPQGGGYQLRGAALEAGSGAVGSVYVDVVVPDFNGEALSMSGLVVSSTTAAGVPTPRPDVDLGSWLQSPPTVARAFTRADTLAAAFALYHNPKKPVGPVSVVTTVAGENGQVRFRSTKVAPEEDLRSSPDGYGYVEQIPLMDMEPGPYVLRVEATTRTLPGVKVVREIPIVVQAGAK